MSRKKVKPAAMRARPLDGRGQMCFTEEEWEERERNRQRGKTKETATTTGSPREFKGIFVGVLREAVDTIFPGAKQAGVGRFILQALRTANQEDIETYEDGIEQVEKLARSAFGKSFLNLPQTDRTAILQKLEGTEFFELLREHTMQGMFADPKYGGNRNMIGWNLIDYPGARFHPITHMSRGWVTDDIVSLRGDVRKNNGKKI
ncbi:gluconate 2-dehydrogenase subunit 3 family protein [Evansella sp. AB-P1]|uniref:gluconate 2-dehydrogenase subunit 3 family protein n=1 Tax=Evansella sp. AB-P1 TaxID=3037653 RepID=UPI00241E1812|nr:gluconate 2-dehydrogenase subunit 3 family protein [Evansella sp. AB-P1]MDG5787270.1 gluconate 2-dehydrogenase subunit 3 family protein [Evansella sp. AB-P1]